MKKCRHKKTADAEIYSKIQSAGGTQHLWMKWTSDVLDWDPSSD